MAGQGRTRGTIRVARTSALLALAWLVAIVVNKPWVHAHALHDWLQDAIYRVLAGFPSAVDLAETIFDRGLSALQGSYAVALFFASFGIPLGYVARMVVRARVRAGGSDLLDVVRGWVKSRPRVVSAVLAVPALAWAGAMYQGITWQNYAHGASAAIAAVSGVLEWFLLRAGLRLFLEPTMAEGDASTMTISDDEIVFDAVAVTRETIGAVVAMALLPVAFVTWAVNVELRRLYTDASVFQGMAAYVAIALGGAFLFKRASRTAVGIDGIRVYGTSRTRFFGYRDLDEARIERADLVLVRKGRVVIRLQLHGEDAVRRDAVLARIASHIEAARDPRAQGAKRFVEAKSTEEVARVALGGGDYRAPSITRDALWQLVEGSTTDGPSRRAAAEALVRTIAPEERARLRIAADKCADVKVRIALQELSEAEIAEPAGTVTAPRAQRA